MATSYDLIVVGAGLIGTSLVLALQQQGLKIAVLEKHLPEFTPQETHEDRPISLAYGSQKILNTLGVWQGLETAARAIEAVQVSEQGVFGGVHFTALEQAVPALGYVVPYSMLYRTLYQRALALEGVTVLPIEQMSSATTDANGVNLSVQTPTGEQSLTAALLVGCDGTRSSVRELFHLPAQKSRLKEAALSATLQLPQPCPGVAVERFTRSGVLALLPLYEKTQYGLVWTMSESQLVTVQNYSDQEFIAELKRQFAARLPQVKAIQRGASFPLQTVIAKKQYQQSVLLLGNSAHTLYPLAAQGFNLGLRDTAVLAEILVEAYKAGKPLSDPSCLQRYVERRMKEQERIRRLTNNLRQRFATRLPLLRGLRGLGMLAIDLVTPFKQQLARLTMGLDGRLPKLVRGIPLW